MATTRTSPPVIDARALDSLLQNTLHLHRQLINRQSHQPPTPSMFSGLGPSASESKRSSLTASRPHTHSSPIESGQNNLSGFLSSSSSTSSFDGFDTPQTSTEINSPKDALSIPFPIISDSAITDLVSSDRSIPSPRMTPPSTSILSTLYNQQHPDEPHQKLNIRTEGQHQTHMVDPVMVRSSVNGSSQPPLPPRPQQQPPQQPPRRIKTSLTTLGASQNSRLVRHLIGTQDSPDSNSDGSVVQVHVRYVPKDLWVKIDLPRDIPVHKARDMILSKCRLTSLPPVDASQPPLPSQETSSRAMNGHLDGFSVDSRMDFKYELDRVLGQHSQLSLDVNDLMTGSRNSATMHDIDEDDSNDDSSDDEEAELRAEALMANDDLFETSPTSSRRFRATSLQGDIPIMPGHRRSNSMTLVTKVSDDKQETSSLKGESRHTVEFATNVKHCNSNALNQQQLKRLLSYSSLHSKGSGSGSTDSRDSGSYSTKRFSNIPGWSHYRNRQQSQNGIQLQREVLEHGGVLADRIDCDSEDQMSSSGTMSSDCVAWKACFGLFWVAAGHWLDDSRMINSYQLQPNCLLELQLRNNYIQLPPPGGQLNYYDHYAEGILYKMSKKSGAVSKLTSHGSGSASKDSTGVWKERWVVLQGTKLFLYHKRKDTTKKVIQLVVPLRISTTVLPINSRHSFKLTQSSLAPLSTTMITLTMSSDPTVPKVCFRATSESEINQWTRIFHSLNDTTLHGIPSTIFSDLSPISPPALPQVQSFSPGHRQRKHTGLGEGSRPKTHHYGAAGTVLHSVLGQETYCSERKRSHTSQGACPPATSIPSISPLVISNAEAVFSHRKQNTGQSTKSRGSEPSKIPGIKDSNDKQLKHSSSNSALGWFGGLTNTNESNSHYRTSSQASTLVGSGPYSNQLSSPIRESIQNQQNIAASTESFWQQQQRLHQEHDRRMKTITDPTPFISASPLAAAKFKLLSPFYNHPKESRLSLKPPSPDNREASQIRLDHALCIRANSSSFLRPVLGSECLDKSAKSPLDSSNSSRSSLTTLYSGYVWLYVPNIPEASALDNTTGVNGTKSNISISKASGRYVKCFAAINDKGQFQWVEVKKAQGEGQEEGGRVTTAAAYMNKTGRRSSSRPSYAIQLSSSPCPSATSGTVIAPEQFSAGRGEAIEVITEPEATVVSSQGGGDTGSRIVQASMAHKLRLYFFCIKISPASLAEVMSELSAASSDAPSLKPMPNKEAAMSRAQSTPKTRSPLAGIVLPPRTTSLPSARAANESAAVASTVANDAPVAVPISTPRVRSETEPAKPYSLQNSQKFPTWPSMSPLHSDKSRNSRMMRMSRTVSSTSISSTTSTACAPVQESTSKTPGMISFERERTMSAPPGSYRASQLCRPGFATLGRHDSICSTRSMLQHTTYIRSNSVLTASPAVMASHRALTGGAKLVNKEGPIRTLPNSSSAPSLTTCAAASASSSPPSLDPELKSNVLTLAQDLQKVMLSHHSSTSSKSSGEQGDRPVSIQSTASSCLSRPKLSLSETMAVKRASLQESTASTFRSLQHKPSLGNISDVVEECEQEDKAAEQKQRQVLKLMCPFLEQSEHVDAQGRTYVTLKGYTETEEGWKSLQSALERFIDGPISDQRSALPPVDTLIPSYNSPPIPEMRQSERAQNFWNAKAKLSEAAYVASLLVSSPATAPSTTGNVPGRSESVQGFSSLGHSTKILASGLGHRASLQTGGRTRPMTSASMLACPPPLFQRAS